MNDTTATGLSACYRINSASVINDTIDNESVIINLTDGFYYSLDDVGSIIWEAVSLGYSVAEIVNYLNSRYQGDGSEIEDSTHALIAELEREQLIVPEEYDAGHPTLDSAPSASSYSRPVLNKFGDMQDLLLLDPIHDVDEKGWPFSDKGKT